MSKIIQGVGFTVQAAKAGSRKGVKQNLRRLLGPEVTAPNFMQVFASEDQLAKFSRRRVETTVMKLMTATALSYAFRLPHPHLVVTGAKLQDIKGSSGSILINGQRYLSGFEAAHFGIGTLSRGSMALSQDVYRKLAQSAEDNGHKALDIHQHFPNSAALTALLMAHDAATYSAPAFINRSEGLLEVKKQHFMLSLMSTSTPKNAMALENSLRIIGDRTVDLFLKHRVIVDPVDKRLNALQQGNGSEFLQNPNDPIHLRLFNGTETEFLQIVRDESANSNSELISETQRIGNDTGRRASELAALAEAARQENS